MKFEGNPAVEKKIQEFLPYIESTIMEFVVYFATIKSPGDFVDFKYSDKINNFIRTELAQYVGNTVPSNRGHLYRLDDPKGVKPAKISVRKGRGRIAPKVLTEPGSMLETRFKTVVDIYYEKKMPMYLHIKQPEGIYPDEEHPGVFYVTAKVRGQGP